MSDNVALNKRAFDEVIGDPFAIPEPIDGFYNKFQSRSSMGAQQYNFDECHATRNPAQPSQLDFLCDVEIVLAEAIKSTVLLKRFVTTYLEGDIDSNEVLTHADRSVLEQHVGKLFRAYNISPVDKYFTTIRTGSTSKR